MPGVGPEVENMYALNFCEHSSFVESDYSYFPWSVEDEKDVLSHK